MSIVINPGSEPIENTSEAHAITNIQHFITDLGEPDIEYCRDIRWVRCPWLDENGRYGFLVWLELYAGDVHGHYITMPGWPLEQVRWMEEPHQNIWNFPRLYVDGSSWVWKFALSATTFECQGEDA